LKFIDADSTATTTVVSALIPRPRGSVAGAKPQNPALYRLTALIGYETTNTTLAAIRK